MTKNNPTVGFQNLPNSKVASRQLIRSIYQPGCIIINNCALCPLQAQGMASVPRSLRYACERAHTLGQSDCTASRKQGRARSEIACRDGKLVVTLHRPNAGTDARHHLQETHKQLNANTKTFHIMSKNIKAVERNSNIGHTGRNHFIPVSHSFDGGHSLVNAPRASNFLTRRHVRGLAPGVFQLDDVGMLHVGENL